MKHAKTALMSLFLLAVCGTAFAQQGIFNKNLSASDRQKLESGELVIKKTGSASKLCVNGANEFLSRAISTTKALKPAYLAEIIQVRPYVEGEDFLATFDDRIMDIDSYVGIPYYSERNDHWTDLYSSADILSLNRTPQGSDAVVDLEMDPFGQITTSIHSERTQDAYYYISTNDSVVKYDGITCVKKGNMKSIIVIFRDGDNLVLYGIGAVEAPTVFFVKSRIELSFMNRIKTFCGFFFEQL